MGGEEGFEVPVPQVGLGRVIGIVLLMHIIAVGGILAFRKLEQSEATGEGVDAADPVMVEEAPPLDPGPALSDEAIIVDHPTKKGFKRYRVSANESLASIVRGFNASVAEVEKLNNLRQGEKLYVGQWLTVPDNRSAEEVSAMEKRMAVVRQADVLDVSEVTAFRSETIAEKQGEPSVIEKLKPASRPERNETYRVKKGDTAYGIAKRFGVGWDELLEANGMDDPRKLQAGQVIRIP